MEEHLNFNLLSEDSKKQMVDTYLHAKYVPVPKFLQEIDWKLLREQKELLCSIIVHNKDNSLSQLNGIIHLIDAIQDYAVDEMGIDSKEVFDLIPEDEVLCPICESPMKVVIVDDNVGNGIHEEYECPNRCK